MSDQPSFGDVIIVVENCIVERDYDIIFEILDELELNEHSIISMYYYCIELLSKSGDGSVVPRFTTYFKSVSLYQSVLPCLLFAKYPTKIPTLEFFYNSNKTTLEEYLMLWVQLADENDMRIAFDTLMSIPGTDDEKNYTLFKNALAFGNMNDEEMVPYYWLVEELLKRELSRHQPPSDAPYYILEGSELQTEEEMLQSFRAQPLDETQTRLQLIRGACFFYAEKMYQSGEITRPEITVYSDTLLNSTAEYSPSKLQKFMENYKQEKSQLDLQKNTELFRILGPCHPIRDANQLNSEGSYVCERYGGCRMMTCVEHEGEDDDTGLRFERPDLFDWFTGVCDLCSKGIDKKHYAYRILMEEGGFFGCFCSTDHALASLCHDSLSYTLTQKAVNETISTGIYDRKEPEIKAETTEELLESVADFMDFLNTVGEGPDF